MDGEKRDVTIDHINKKIDQAIEVCRKYPIWANLVAKRVSEMSNALVNLEQTYLRKKDQKTAGNIDLIKLRIEPNRFLRACNEPLRPTQVSLPIATNSSLPNTDVNILGVYAPRTSPTNPGSQAATPPDEDKPK